MGVGEDPLGHDPAEEWPTTKPPRALVQTTAELGAGVDDGQVRIAPRIALLAQALLDTLSPEWINALMKRRNIQPGR